MVSGPRAGGRTARPVILVATETLLRSLYPPPTGCRSRAHSLLLRPPSTIGATAMTTQFKDAATGDMKLFVDFTKHADFDTKFSHELQPRLARRPARRPAAELAGFGAAAADADPPAVAETAIDDYLDVLAGGAPAPSVGAGGGDDDSDLDL